MLPALHAERQLAAIEAAVAPHMEKADYRKMTRRYRRVIDRVEKPKPQSAAEALASLPIPVIEEPPRKASE